MCKTAGTVEAWNFILKRVDNCDRHMRPDVFIHQHYEAIIGRQRQFYDDLQKPLKKRVKVTLCICAFM